MPLQQMSLEEEVGIIVNDIFDGDSEMQESCVRELAEFLGMEYDEMTETQIQEMIFDNEDELYSIDASRRTIN